MQEILEGKNPAVNIEIRPNDIISVSEGSSNMIYVVGDVQHAGAFTLGGQRNVSVLRAVSLAGGLGRTAKPEKARIVREVPGEPKPVEIAVNIQQIFSGKAKDVELGPNDVLVVPTSSRKTFTTTFVPSDRLRRRGRCDLPLLRSIWKINHCWTIPASGPIGAEESPGTSLLPPRRQYTEMPFPEVFEEQGPGLLLEYLQILRRRKGTLILIVFLGLLASLLFTLPQTPIYQARGSIEIQNLNQNFLNMRNVSPTADDGALGRARIRSSNAGQNSPERILTRSRWPQSWILEKNCFQKREAAASRLGARPWVYARGGRRQPAKRS